MSKIYGYLNATTTPDTFWGSAYLTFDGNDYVDYGDIYDILSYSCIILFWFKTSTAGNCILSKWNGSGYSIELSTTGRLFARVHDGTTTLSTVDDGAILNDNAWHLGFIEIDRTNNLLKRYYVDSNGNLINTGTNLNISTLGSINTTASLFIGARNNTTTDLYWNGNIGILGKYIFDGQNGSPSSLPSNDQDLMQYIYNNTYFYYL